MEDTVSLDAVFGLGNVMQALSDWQYVAGFR
jgi:hypothetical protein